jgi:fused signal recognition particle receptor
MGALMEPDAGGSQTAEQAAEIGAQLPLLSDPTLWVAGGLGLLILLGVVVQLLRRRSSPQDDAPSSADEAATASADEASAGAEAIASESASEGLLPFLTSALSRSREALQGRFDELFSRPVDESVLEELEEVLITSDIGITTAERILDRLREKMKSGDVDPASLREVLRQQIRELLESVAAPLGPRPTEGLWVILVVGVNGSGKTTTIGKLASKLKGEGLRVLLAAADTYRAAAAEQLTIWADRAEAGIVSHEPGSDPGAVVYDALAAAKARDVDVVIIDTAGRLQTRKPLMEQLSKVRRVIQKQVPSGPHETLLVVDGTMGQNALSQTALFHEATPLTGVVVTKLDGTAKGGMVVTIASEMQLPVKLIGLGEQIGDLREFEADAFVQVLA